MGQIPQLHTHERALELLNIGNKRRLAIIKKHIENPERDMQYMEQRKKLKIISARCPIDSYDIKWILV